MLFPSASKCEEDDTEGEPKTRATNWLENKSFTSETAQKVKVFQRELQILQGHLELDDEDNNPSLPTKPGKDIDDKDIETSKYEHDPSKKRKKKRKHRTDSSLSDDTDKKKKDKYDSTEEVHKYHKQKKHYYISNDEDHDRNSRGKRPETKDDKQSRKHKEKKRKHRHYSSDSLEEDRCKEKKKKKKKHKKHDREKSKSPDLQREPVHNRPELLTPNAVFYDDLTSDITIEVAFRVDRKSDKNSLIYGSLYKQHVAHYKPVCQKCMGTRQGEVVYVQEKEKKKKAKSNRYFDKENRKAIKQVPLEVITSNKQDTKVNTRNRTKTIAENIIRLETRSDNKHDGIDVRGKILDPATALYIQGKPSSGHSSDLSKDMHSTVPTPTQVKVTEFNRRLQETPDDIQLWLDFVKFQDTVFAEGDGFGATSSAGFDGKLMRAVLEKKISIVEKALQANPGNIDLVLHKLELNSDLVDGKVINKELEQLLFVHVANTQLWRYYLKYNQSKLSLFTVTRMIKLYHKCLKVLFSVLEGKVHTHSVPENLCKDVLGIVSRAACQTVEREKVSQFLKKFFSEIVMEYCCFLKQAGHREKATGTLQALLEYNICCPASLRKVERDRKKAAFEEFWDSEVPRVGCEGAPSWDVWFNKKESPCCQSETDNLEELEEGIIENKYPRYKTWLSIETLRESHHSLPWLPGQGQTDEDCEDAERIVVFDDISPALFDIPSDLYLDFIIAVIALDQDMSTEFSHQLMIHFKYSYEHADQVPNLSLSHLSNFLSISPSGISLKFLTQVIPHFSKDEQTVLTLLYVEISLKSILKNRDVAELSKSEKKEVRKILKAVLKQVQNRSNLFIWAAYIQIERQIGKQEEFQSIAETAISMHSGALVRWFVLQDENPGKKKKDDYESGLANIFVQYMEILLGIGCVSTFKLLPRSSGVSIETKNKILYLIGCLIDGKKVDLKTSVDIQGSTLLRIHAKFPKYIQYFTKHLQTSSQNPLLLKKEFVQVCWCYSLFSYCSDGIQSALGVHTQLLEILQNQGHNTDDLEERLQESKMRLIVYHMTVSPSPLHILRKNLDELLVKYPGNPKFLALYMDVEKKARISGRINRYFDKQSRLTKSPLPVIFAVCDLIGLVHDATGDYVRDKNGILNRARSWLENYIGQSSNSQCPLIWRLYLYIEVLCDKESRMKGLFYRAIQQCPWNKNVYKDGIQELGEERLQEIVDLMIEKELRVQLPVEELDILIE